MYDHHNMRFVFEDEIIRGTNGIPLELNMQFIQTFRNQSLGETYILRTLANQMQTILKQEFARVFYPTGRSNPRNILPRIRGYLSVVSIDTGRMASFSSIRADEITYAQLLFYLEERIQQSNLSAPLNLMSWKFVIDPTSVTVGGMGKVRTSYANKPFDQYCYSEHVDDQGYIGCAAFALACSMYFENRNNRNRVTVEKLKEKARELQTALQWDRFVSFSELQQFVDMYPDYRVTIVMSGNSMHFRHYTYEGRQFDSSVLTDSRQVTAFESKIIYLVYDMKEQHYFPVRSPLAFLFKEKGSRKYKFCHTCVELFDPQTTEHFCDVGFTETQPTKKRRIRVCEFCKQHHGGKCNCTMSRCTWCQTAHEEGSVHRCIVTKTVERSEDQKLFYDGSQEQYGKFYSLWAYDLEARISKKEYPVETIESFIVDEEYRFNGEVVRFSVEVREHKANLVVARNVITDEERIFEGDDCLKEFIEFMTFYNKGICILTRKKYLCCS